MLGPLDVQVLTNRTMEIQKTQGAALRQPQDERERAQIRLEQEIQRQERQVHRKEQMVDGRIDQRQQRSRGERNFKQKRTPVEEKAQTLPERMTHSHRKQILGDASLIFRLNPLRDQNVLVCCGNVFFYFLWEKRKLNKRLKATITRLEQVEELLLEMCGLIEPFEEEAALISKEKKEQEKSTDSPVERKEDSAYEPAKQPVIAEAGDKQQEPVPRTKAQDVGGGSFLFEERTAEGPPSEGEPVGSTPAETGGRIEPEAVEDQNSPCQKRR